MCIVHHEEGRGTHPRKMNPQGGMARKLENNPQSRAPLQWGEVVGNTMAGRHHGCPGGIPCNTQSKEETGEKGEAKEKCQGHAKGRTLMLINVRSEIQVFK